MGVERAQRHPTAPQTTVPRPRSPPLPAPLKANAGGRGTRAPVSFRVALPKEEVVAGGDANATASMAGAPVQEAVAMEAAGPAAANDPVGASGPLDEGAYRLDMKLGFQVRGRARVRIERSCCRGERWKGPVEPRC